MTRKHTYRFAKHQELDRPLRGVCSRCGAVVISRQPRDMPDHMETGRTYTALVPCQECEEDGCFDSGATVSFRLTVTVEQIG